MLHWRGESDLWARCNNTPLKAKTDRQHWNLSLIKGRSWFHRRPDTDRTRNPMHGLLHRWIPDQRGERPALNATYPSFCRRSKRAGLSCQKIQNTTSPRAFTSVPMPGGRAISRRGKRVVSNRANKDDSLYFVGTLSPLVPLWPQKCPAV